MKKNLRYLAGVAVGAVVSLGFSSCAYDPYYASSGGGSYGGGYSSGYGDSYGYGGSSFSSSVFISTGDPQWGYDPNCYSYYDYRRRCYYDPYLNGYYPVGYRPPIVYGVPHPYGWRPGSGHCRPPSHVSNITITNYRDRESSYRNSSYGWARQVRQGSSGGGRTSDQHSSSSGYDRQNSYSRPESRSSTQGGSWSNPGRESSRPYSQPTGRTESSDRSSSRYSSRYNTPVTDYQPSSYQRSSRQVVEPRPQREIRQIAEPDVQRSSRQQVQPYSQGNFRQQAQPSMQRESRQQAQPSEQRGRREESRQSDSADGKHNGRTERY